MQQHRRRGRVRSRDRARMHLRRRLRLPAIGEVEVSIQDSDELAGGWRFAHLRVLLRAWRSGRIEFEPELLHSHADAHLRAPLTELQVPANLRHPSVLIRVVWRPARLHDFRCQACSEPDLRRPACSRPSQDRPRWSGPLERLSTVGRAGTMSSQVPILQRRPLPAPLLPLACLLPGSVEIDRGFSPPRNPGMPGLLLFWVAGHSPGSWLASALDSPPPPKKWPTSRGRPRTL